MSFSEVGPDIPLENMVVYRTVSDDLWETKIVGVVVKRLDEKHLVVSVRNKPLLIPIEEILVDCEWVKVQRRRRALAMGRRRVET